ncbi:MAG: response regulator [Alphaproteobacteria bacterium]|nr:response regulator [Alphaproteobacteria bacterium]
MTATQHPGSSILLVEDEVIIRLMVADMLVELGYRIAAETGDINEALRLAQSTSFDLAILDVNVNGRTILPVADLLRARGLPFIFATGYGSSSLPESYRDRPALEKPFQLEALSRTIEAALRPA